MVHERLKARGFYSVVCRDKDGNIKWSEPICNLVTVEGKTLLLDTMFGGAAAVPWYFGLVSLAGFSAMDATDTMASHTGWAEATNYSESSRIAASFAAAYMGEINLTAAMSFSITSAADIAGMFLCSGSTKGGTTGVLYSVGGFAGGVKPVISGDTLQTSYTAIA